MSVEDAALPKSVGRLVVTGGRATAFLVAPTRALTCAHCLRTGSGEFARTGTISFTQSDEPGDVPFQTEFVSFDEEAGLDVAVLKLERQVPGTACLPFAVATPTAGS